MVPGAGGGDNPGYDPDWDDDWEIDRSFLDSIEDDEDAGSATLEEVDIEALGVVPKGDEEVTEVTKSWVQAGILLHSHIFRSYIRHIMYISLVFLDGNGSNEVSDLRDDLKTLASWQWPRSMNTALTHARSIYP